jgi:hypothetical protein
MCGVGTLAWAGEPGPHSPPTRSAQGWPLAFAVAALSGIR